MPVQAARGLGTPKPEDIAIVQPELSAESLVLVLV